MYILIRCWGLCVSSRTCSWLVSGSCIFRQRRVTVGSLVRCATTTLTDAVSRGRQCCTRTPNLRRRQPSRTNGWLQQIQTYLQTREDVCGVSVALSHIIGHSLPSRTSLRRVVYFSRVYISVNSRVVKTTPIQWKKSGLACLLVSTNSWVPVYAILSIQCCNFGFTTEHFTHRTTQLRFPQVKS